MLFKVISRHNGKAIAPFGSNKAQRSAAIRPSFSHENLFVPCAAKLLNVLLLSARFKRLRRTLRPRIVNNRQPGVIKGRTRDVIAFVTLLGGKCTLVIFQAENCDSQKTLNGTKDLYQSNAKIIN